MAMAKKSVGFHTGYDKKHDSPTRTHEWSPAIQAHPWFLLRKRRLLQVILAVLAVYLFVKYLPTDLPTVDQRVDSRTGLSQGRFPIEVSTSPNKLEKGQLYDGQVRFYNLAASLRPHIHAENGDKRNIVFLLYDLRAAASLISLACRFGEFQRTIVHVAVVSPQDTKTSDIWSLTGTDPADCPVYWHDARPDYNTQSSSARRALSIKSAMNHLHAQLQPSVFVVDEPQLSQQGYKLALKAHADSLWTPLVVVPSNALASMDWIPSLDGPALATLTHIELDILITPYKNSAGSLLRLIESIKNADYGGLPHPRIIVEIPQHIDPFALKYLEDFRWSTENPSGQNRLVLRRRFDQHPVTASRASLRTIESFYPSNMRTSHMLLLSPEVELSSEYFQYLMYILLEYKYGKAGRYIASSVTGISLDTPKEYTPAPTPFQRSNSTPYHPHILSHVPSTTAALYFGDKWVELQDYTTLRLAHDPDLSSTIPDHTKPAEQQPAWLGLASEFMSAINHVMLYPTFAAEENFQLITTHKEFHQSPDEFVKLAEMSSVEQKAKIVPPSMDGEFLTTSEDVVATHAHLHHKQSGTSRRSIRRLLGLQAYEPLPADSSLPFVTHDGHYVEHAEASTTARAFADKLSLSIGGCRSLKDRNENKFGSAEYLFCSYEGSR